MGSCVSTPAPPLDEGNHLETPPTDSSAQPDGPFEARRPSTERAQSLQLQQMVAQVHELHLALSLISSHPLLALPDAAQVLLERLEVDAIGVYCFCPPGASGSTPSASLVAAAGGAGAEALERHPVVWGQGWSCMKVLIGDTDEGTHQGMHGGLPCAQGARVLVLDAGAPGERDLPTDYALLRSAAGLSCLATVPIGLPGAAPFGALVLGKAAPNSMAGDWCQVWGGSAAAGLLQHLRCRQVSDVAAILRDLDESQDPIEAIITLLQSAARFMHDATNIAMGPRLGLLNEQQDTVTLFELARRSGGGRGAPRSSSCSSNSGSLVKIGGCGGEAVSMKELPLSSTLLATAITEQKARFVQDCAVYVQNCRRPARDVLTHSREVVKSVVAVPLIVDGRALGGLYFTQATKCDFGNIQEVLVGFVYSVTLAISTKIASQGELLKEMVAQACTDTPHQSCGSLSGTVHLAPPLREGGLTPPTSQKINAMLGSQGDLSRHHHHQQRRDSTAGSDQGAPRGASSDSSDVTDDTASDCSAVPPLPSASGRLSKISSKRLCTEAMLSVLQQEIRSIRRRSVELSFVADHLVVGERIGMGGYSTVFLGSWHRRPAAIKVFKSRSSDGEAVSDAMEMAVLSSLQHPNIVQVYACLTDMVEVKQVASFPGAGPEGGLRGAAAPSKGRTSYRRFVPGVDDDLPTVNIMAMEYMDRGTLADAVTRGGLFHRRMQGGAIGVKLDAVVDVLIELASSLDYLHGMGLLHADVKLDNILLKSDHLRPLGVVPKLADFGLTRIVKEGDDAARNHSGAGTVTHLAVELFTAGSRITPAVDVYAFGIMMYEFHTGKRAYAGLPPKAVAERVRAGARPAFPRGAPTAFVSLAESCWAADPLDRPPFSEVVARLNKISASLLLAKGAAGGG